MREDERDDDERRDDEDRDVERDDDERDRDVDLRAPLRREAAAARPPFRPPFRAGALFVRRPRPEPLFFPPPLILLTVAHARRSASSSDRPRSSYPSSMCSA